MIIFQDSPPNSAGQRSIVTGAGLASDMKPADKPEKPNKQHPDEDNNDNSGAAVIISSTEQSTVDSEVSLLQIQVYCLDCALHGGYLTATVMRYLTRGSVAIIVVEAKR